MHTYIATIQGQEYRVEILGEGKVAVNGKVYEVDFRPIGEQSLYSLLASGRSYEANIVFMDGAWEVLLDGVLYVVQVEDERERRLRAQAGRELASQVLVRIKSPMPGLVVDVRVRPGDEVEKGQVLLLLESMKMQNEIRAPRKGTVLEVHVEPGQSVNQNQVLVELQ